MEVKNKSVPSSSDVLDVGYVWFDGRIIPQEQATVSALTHALHYGTSVFEGIRAYETTNGPAIFRLKEHVKRLLDSAKIMGMIPQVNAEEIEQATIETIHYNNRQSCYIRPLIWYGAEALGVNPGQNQVHFMVATWEWGTYLGEEAVQKGATLMTSSWRRSSGDILPTKAKVGGNYVNSVLANQEARDNGFDEALLLDSQGFVAEGSGENIFLYQDDVLMPISHSVNLRGITRDSVIRIANWMDIPVESTMATRDELYTADELFMVGTAAEVTPIASIDRRPIGSGAAGPFSLKMRKIYLDVVCGGIPEFNKWLTYVG